MDDYVQAALVLSFPRWGGGSSEAQETWADAGDLELDLEAGDLPPNYGQSWMSAEVGIDDRIDGRPEAHGVGGRNHTPNTTVATVK